MRAGSPPQRVLVDERTSATDPGGFALSRRKLAKLHPELAAPWWRRWLLPRVAGNASPALLLAQIGEHLMRGDSRAAVVVSIAPLRIAAYSDDLDAIALLAFPDAVANGLDLAPGSRLLTVNIYTLREAGIAADLVEGPAATWVWGNFLPLIAEFLTDDGERLRRRRAEIAEAEWQRASELAAAYVARHGLAARDGRPLACGRPAALPGGAA